MAGTNRQPRPLNLPRPSILRGRRPFSLLAPHSETTMREFLAYLVFLSILAAITILIGQYGWLFLPAVVFWFFYGNPFTKKQQ